MYEEGEKFKKDDCTECTCVNEKIECQTETCKEPAQLKCLNPITKAGECCPVCEDEVQRELNWNELNQTELKILLHGMRLY